MIATFGEIADCMFNQEGERLSGRCEDATLLGEIKSDTELAANARAGTHDTVIFTGVFLDDEQAAIVGKFSYVGKGNGSFLAIKR